MKNAIDQAKYLMRCRKFTEAISILNSRRQNYEGSFDFFYTLGLAFLYAGDTGSALQNFSKAREIRITDENLMFAQAAIYLRRGETDRAVQYYLDILDMNEHNVDARRALDFVREHGDYDEICRFVDDGRIEAYYPSLGFNPARIKNLALALCFGALFGFLLVRFWPKNYFASRGRADLSELALTVSEKSSIQKEIESAYYKASHLFQEGRDNAAQFELNKILRSNPSASLKEKCGAMSRHFSRPTFDTLKDNYAYEDVAKESSLYLDCYVDWSGRVANLAQENNFCRFDLLVGYENGEILKGIVPVTTSDIRDLTTDKIDNDRPIRVLGKIANKDGRLVLKGVSVYQSVKDVYKN